MSRASKKRRAYIRSDEVARAADAAERLKPRDPILDWYDEVFATMNSRQMPAVFVNPPGAKAQILAIDPARGPDDTAVLVTSYGDLEMRVLSTTLASQREKSETPLAHETRKTYCVGVGDGDEDDEGDGGDHD